ncbi:hypothetical protein P153DRAFT_320278 [Dothidotthia symphoricarpi CBS 119687]|uniref:Uncharacterized protein n=1 Tax=Dothidotthia symphoricarpi CBS 119687 TaxID=1392245 RepID=A0A6A6A8A5_9PLEO|nr:uncharacterized protein P153DRAFT_320278 [Dothidotthia symphoricarpi CBS 119687]KAF2127786.1 hypothetical protein P153DRAFT_320278 [Dothidotthia symphoricarpi CBS 119687]
MLVALENQLRRSDKRMGDHRQPSHDDQTQHTPRPKSPRQDKQHLRVLCLPRDNINLRVCTPHWA